MQNLEKLVEYAEELKLATLRAAQQNILQYCEITNSFQVSSRVIPELITNREYSVREIGEGLEYSTEIGGLNFFAIKITKENRKC